MSSSKRNHYKEKLARRKEEKAEEPEQPKYRDRAKERREDQNPDYDPTELSHFHAVAPPGTVQLRSADEHKLSIEKSKYLGGDVEHTHLVKGLDYALLNKVRSEIDKKPDVDDDANEKAKGSKEDQLLSFRTATAKSVYKWIVKPQTVIKTNEMFLPRRMSFIYNMVHNLTVGIRESVASMVDGTRYKTLELIKETGLKLHELAADGDVNRRKNEASAEALMHLNIDKLGSRLYSSIDAYAATIDPKLSGIYNFLPKGNSGNLEDDGSVDCTHRCCPLRS